MLEALLEERRLAGLPVPTLVERDIDDQRRAGAGVLRDDPGGRARRPTPRARDQPGQAPPAARRRRREPATPLRDAPRLPRPAAPTSRSWSRSPRACSASSRRACCRSCPRTSARSPRLRSRRPPDRRFVGHRAGSPSGTRSPTSPASAPCSRSSGVTATYAAGPLVDYLPLLRQLGGILLIVLGLNLAGILRIPVLERTWRPLDAGAASSLAGMTGTMALARPGPAGRRRARTGSAAGSSAAATAGSPRSGSARSSRSAGRRASASCSAAC